MTKSELIKKLVDIVERLHIGDGDEAAWSEHDQAWDDYEALRKEAGLH